MGLLGIKDRCSNFSDIDYEYDINEVKINDKHKTAIKQYQYNEENVDFIVGHEIQTAGDNFSDAGYNEDDIRH